MDSHRTNKTYQEEYKEQFKNLIDEWTNWTTHRDGKTGRYLKDVEWPKIKQPQTATLEYYNIEKDGDKYVLL